MANRKEFEMAFKLSAQLNGSYQSTFKSAQSVLASMQKEITALNRAQSDISAYQKQQEAVEGTKKKLKVLKQQYDNIQKELAETKGFSSDLENKLLSKQQQIDKTTASLGKQTEKLSLMETELQQAGVDTNNLTQESKRLETEMQGLKKQQEEAAESAQDYGEKGAQAFEAVSSALAAAGIVSALKEIAEGYMECIQAAGNYEETMSTVEALSGANSGEMEELSNLAKQLGAETKYTAQESAEAMTYMAMAGWGTTDMLQGMDGVIQLAAASGEELASVSDIVTDNLTAFGMTAADTAHFSDVLAAAATNSNTSVSVMGETFKQSASIAGALGYSIDDVAVAVGLMANSGIKGSIAGTALKNTFNGLLEGVTLTGEALGDYEFTAMKSDGTMKGFAETVDELRACFNQMTDAEKVGNAMAIAGSRSYNGLLAVINATDADYASLTNSIQNCTGAASKMAAIKMDNMNGELKLAQSAWEGVTIAVGEQFTPVMGEVYKVAAKVFGQLKEFIEDHPALVKAVTAFTAVVGLAVGGLTAYAAIVKVIKLLDLASLFTGPVGMIIGVIGGVAALTAGIVGLMSAMNEGIPSVKELTEAAGAMDEAMSLAAENFQETSTNMMATASVAEDYIGRLEEIEAETGGNVKGNKEYHNILELLMRTIPELTDCIDLENDSIKGGTQALRQRTEAWKQDAKTRAQQEYVNSLYDEYNAVTTEAAENSIKLTQAEMKERKATENMEAAQKRMNELWAEASEKARKNSEETGMFTDVMCYLSDEYHELENSLWEYNNEIYAAEKAQKNLDKAIEEDKRAIEEAEAVIEEAEAAIEEMTASEREAAEAAALIEEQTAAVSETIGGVLGRVTELTEVYNEAYQAAFESISGQYSLWSEAAEVVEKSAADINNAMQSQVTYWQDYNANLQLLSERSGEIEGLSNVIASFADGSEDSVNAIAGMATASDEDLRAMVENWQTLQAEQEEAAGSIADLKTNFTEEMDNLAQELAADIEALDLGPEAAIAGKSTVQGFIDGAKGMSFQVQSAYAGIAAAAQAALNSASSAGNKSKGKGKGYATGTVSAEPGFAEVGENGPEIMFMHGGEKILTAAETARVKRELSSSQVELQAAGPQLQAYARAQDFNALQAQNMDNSRKNITLTNNPVIQVNGDKPGDLEAKLEENNQRLLQRLENLLDGRADYERRARFA